MKVIVIKSFSGRNPDGSLVHHGEGDVFELPKGADWIEAGLVEPFDDAQDEVDASTTPAAPLSVEFAVSEREIGRGKTRKNADKKKEG